MNASDPQDKRYWFTILFSRKGFLGEVFILSVLLHLIFLVVAGSLVIFRNIFPNNAQFEGEKVAKKIDPRKLEYRVKVQEQQKKSGRPQVNQRVVAQRISNFSLPKLTVEPNKNLEKVRFTPANFNLSGAGVGLGSGRGLGGLGLGESKVNFFGITGIGERIFFMVDVSESMAEDERGGYPGFEKLKEEVARMVDGLSPTTFYNIAVFAEGVQTMESQMQRASPENKKMAKPFLDRFLTFNGERYSTNVSRDYQPPAFYKAGKEVELVTTDTSPREVKPSELEWRIERAGGGSTRTDLAVLAALQQDADTIFIISDGNPWVWATLEGPDLERLNRRRQDWFRDWASDGFKKLHEERAAAVERHRSATAERARKGLPPKAQEGVGGGPGPPYLPRLSSEQVVAAIRDSYKRIREERAANADPNKMPRRVRIYTVGYATTKPEEEFLRKLSSKFGGRHRSIKSLVPPIKE